MWMVGSIARELEQQTANAKLLGKVVHDAKALFENEVHYREHFDPDLLSKTLPSDSEEHEYLLKLNAEPWFIILGCSNYAKAAVANELIGQNLLPTVAAEEHMEKTEGFLEFKEEPWRGILLQNGDSFKCSIIHTKDIFSKDFCTMVEHSFTPSDRNGASTSKMPIRLVQSDPGEGEPESVCLQVNQNLLKAGSSIYIPRLSSNNVETYTRALHQCCLSSNHVPIPIYVISSASLTEQDTWNLKNLRAALPDQPVLFIKTRAYVLRSELPEADLCMRYNNGGSSSMDDSSSSRRGGAESSRPSRPRYITCFSAASSDSESAEGSPPPPMIADEIMLVRASMRQQLMAYGCLSQTWQRSRRGGKNITKNRETDSIKDHLSDLIETAQDFPKLIHFVKEILRYRMIDLADRCHQWHESLLQLFIYTAYDMARDQLVTPKRLEYAKTQEKAVYRELCKLSLMHPDTLQSFYMDTLGKVRFQLLETAAGVSDLNEQEVADFVLEKVKLCLGEGLSQTVTCLRESFVGTLRRCIDHVTSKETVDVEEVDQVKKALQQLLNSTYCMRLDISNSDSILKAVWLRFKQVHHEVCCSTRTKSPPVPDQQFAQGDDKDDKQLIRGDSRDSTSSTHSVSSVIDRTVDKLESIKLAKILNIEFRFQIKSAHETFQCALDRLYKYHTERLAKAEAERLKLRKGHAPRLSRYAMESLALKERLINGMPKLGHEIGRGQYGVVYSAEKWGSLENCAIKSVVPPDDKHWNDLAMEFYYTRSLFNHDRIVRVYGAVIDHDYGCGDGQPAVLLVMQRFKRDLYIAIKSGLDWRQRLSISVDVVEGLRFLHSRGLVHRDIKLKNVLLDEDNRAKLTDLGFCKPEAMMSGSIVGTPIHMAPELFTGQYDASVDVYAFGVLFWYVCAGHVHLPSNFQECLSKDHLWDSVRNGVRPEQLKNFEHDCWKIMRRCWDGNPKKRPLLGDIQPQLEGLLKRHIQAEQSAEQRQLEQVDLV